MPPSSPKLIVDSLRATHEQEVSVGRGQKRGLCPMTGRGSNSVVNGLQARALIEGGTLTDAAAPHARPLGCKEARDEAVTRQEK